MSPQHYVFLPLPSPLLRLLTSAQHFPFLLIDLVIFSLVHYHHRSLYHFTLPTPVLLCLVCDEHELFPFHVPSASLCSNYAFIVAAYLT
jgi:hypothetical protein